MERNPSSYEIRDNKTNEVLWRFTSAIPEDKLIKIVLDYAKQKERNIYSLALCRVQQLPIPNEMIDDYRDKLKTRKHYQYFIGPWPR